VREGLFAAFENWKAEHEVKDSQDVVASLVVPNGRAKMLGSFGEDLPILFKFSAVEVAEGPEALTFRKSEFLKCERSRLRRANVEVVDGVPLSARDRKVLQI
jgi:isoleucyl-tRNA synthetase